VKKLSRFHDVWLNCCYSSVVIVGRLRDGEPRIHGSILGRCDIFHEPSRPAVFFHLACYLMGTSSFSPEITSGRFLEGDHSHRSN
jgi:hypothetical protein